MNRDRRHAFGEYIRTVPLVLRVVLLLGAFAVVGYWCMTDSGLYRMFRSGPPRSATELIFYPRAALYALGVVLVPVVVVLIALAAMFAKRRRG